MTLALAVPRPRLIRLFVTCRQLPAALGFMVGCGVLLRTALELNWIQGTGPQAQAVPLPIEGVAAVVIALTARSPFGELERTAPARLPWLRLGGVLMLASVAYGAMCLAAIGKQLPGGDLELLYGVAGLSGIGLLTAAVVGGSVAWAGPLAYLVFAEYAIQVPLTLPWVWADRPPDDRGAATCALLLFATGLAIVAARGTRTR